MYKKSRYRSAIPCVLLLVVGHMQGYHSVIKHTWLKSEQCTASMASKKCNVP